MYCFIVIKYLLDGKKCKNFLGTSLVFIMFPAITISGQRFATSKGKHAHKMQVAQFYVLFYAFFKHHGRFSVTLQHIQCIGIAVAFQVMCMKDYDVAKMEFEDLILVVASTFGSGDPPDNGEKFYKSLKKRFVEQGNSPSIAS